uniref:Uncharacterized protein n=1 Tax=uncultured marine virus TaxID=186617 RepID=A0A0F7L586_9VIRU|nr:hypothetical protein [uncultured marine virus]
MRRSPRWRSRRLAESLLSATRPRPATEPRRARRPPSGPAPCRTRPCRECLPGTRSGHNADRDRSPARNAEAASSRL